MQSYVIHLVRHGLTSGNLEGRYIGSTDLPLCPQGEKELCQLRGAQPLPPVEVVYSSPLKRCCQTARLYWPDKQPQLVTDLREADFGEWEGRTAAQLQGDPRFAAWVQGQKGVDPPGGENAGWAMQRCCAAFEQIVDGLLRTQQHSAAIVAHGSTLMSILSNYGLPRAHFYDWMCQPGHGYSLRITPALWMRSMVAEVYDTLPPRVAGAQQDNAHMVLDVAREAAQRAWGGKNQPE